MGAYSNLLQGLVPVSYWRLGDTVGTVAVDEMRLNHGAYIAAPTLGVAGALTGDVDKAVTLNGTSQAIDLAASANLHPGDTITIAAWVKRAVNGATHHIWHNGGSDAELYFQSDNKLNFGKAGIAALFVSTATFTDGLYHFIVATKAGATIVVYADGVAIAGTVTNFTLVASGGGSRIGSAVGGGNWFNGTMDEVALWSRALTAVEVANLYAAAIGTAGTFDTIAVALAARFNATAITAAGGPPTGLTNIRLATADLPNTIDALPCVLVFPDSGEFTHSAGKRDSVHEFLIRFYYSQATDLRRDMIALRQWLAILVNQLKLAAQLGGIVTQAKVMTWKIGVLAYAGDTYTGIELGVSINVNEPWSPVS